MTVGERPAATEGRGDRYEWIALSNATMGVFAIFPTRDLVSGSFHHGLVTVFTAAATMAVVAAIASSARGRTPSRGQ